MTIAWLDGELLPLEQARISPMDRGFLFGDSVYEVIPVYAGTPFRLDKHLERLGRSLSAIGLDDPHSRNEWKEMLAALIERNGGGNLALYVQVTRGQGSKRDHAFPGADIPPTVFATVSPVDPPAADHPETATGVSVITRDDIRWSRCDIKTTALLANVLLRQEASREGAAEAILLRDGFVTEGAASNVFVVLDGTVVTPPNSHLILPGITRDLVIELCREHGIAVEEREITETQLRHADEIWLSSSTKELVPAVRLNGHVTGDGTPGPVWKQLARHYVDFKRTLCGVS